MTVLTTLKTAAGPSTCEARIDMAQMASAAPVDVPVSFTIAVLSALAMLTVGVSFFVSYLFRHPIERIEQSIQGLRHSRYVKHIQGPAVAVFVAAVGGYGVNVLTQDTGLSGYVGLLLTLPVPLAIVAYTGLHDVRRAEFEEQWPPDSLRVVDRVKLRFVLRRVQAEGRALKTADLAHLDQALRRLLDEALPAVRARRDRTLRQWLRGHWAYAVANLVWVLFTLFCATLAVLPDLRHGDWTLLRVPGTFAVVVLLTQTGLVVVRRRHSRYRYNALAEELETVAGGLRRRLTKSRLGLLG